VASIVALENLVELLESKPGQEEALTSIKAYREEYGV
jgi:hypothetical protein